MKKIFFTSLLLLKSAFSAETEPVTEGNNDFACAFYSQIKQEENPLFSPISFYACMGMVYSGAQGNTADEMAQTFHFPFCPSQIGQAIGTLHRSLIPKNFEKNSLQLTIANSAWIDERTAVLPSYSDTLKAEFGAKIVNLDFRKSGEAASQINEWVKDSTKGKITKLFDPGDLSEDSRLVLANAVYFKGKWKKTFNPDNTKNGSFYPIQKDSVLVKMMHQEGWFPYFENGEIQVLALPFEGTPETYCLIALPHSDIAIENLENSLSHSLLHDWLENLRHTNIRMEIPKFKLRLRTPAVPILKSLGLNLPFSPLADFSGITDGASISLTDVIHEACFDLDEAGVTAAAVTGASMSVSTSYSPPKKFVSFIADHPFLFFLIDPSTETILFMGKYELPDGENATELS